MLTCFVALCTVCTAGRKGRDINLITGVEHRLRTFFSLTAYSGSFIEELNLVRDFVIGQSPPPPQPTFFCLKVPVSEMDLAETRVIW